jgi:hypothetical protein
LTKGPVFGSLILTKDGNSYNEFSKISFQYNQIKYSENYDFFYPTQFTIKAESSNETIYLKFEMTNKPIEYINRFNEDKFFRGFVIVEGPGRVTGYHDDGSNKTELYGICKIEPQRQISILGHNELDISLIRPPSGLGIKLSFESHFIKKHLRTKLVFNPWPHCSFSIKNIDSSLIHKN